MSLFSEIQNDILSDQPISTILRKAKVLAYRLKNQEFKDWVEFESNGYNGDKAISLPDYRKFKSQSFGDFINMRWQTTNAPIPLSIFPQELQEAISSIELREGAKEFESMIAGTTAENGSYKYLWPPEMLPFLHNRIYENMNCLNAWRVISRNQIAQILDTIRNRLLNFILELSDRYPEDTKSDFENSVKIPDDQISQVFNYFIMGNNPHIVGSTNTVLQGSNMSVFDQRNQTVEYQYNAARDINLEAVTNRTELTTELNKLRHEVKNAVEAKVIDDEIATDIDYKLAKTIQQSRKPQPDKKSMVENINDAIALLGGISSAVGLVTAFVRAAELIHKFF